MGRHRHAVNVRVDGLPSVLGRLLDDRRIRSAALVDVDSGMVLDACGPGRSGPDPSGSPGRDPGVPDPGVRDPGTAGGPDPGVPDLEVLSAGHADLVRATLAVLHGGSSGCPVRCEVVADDGAGRHHVVRVLSDAHGGLLALSVVVAGPERVVARVRRRLRRVSDAALTAGPSAVRRPPVTGAATRATPASPPEGREGREGPPTVGVGPSVIGRGPAPPSALPSSRR